MSIHDPRPLQSGSPGQSASSQPIFCQPLLHVHVADVLSQPPVRTHNNIAPMVTIQQKVIYTDNVRSNTV